MIKRLFELLKQSQDGAVPREKRVRLASAALLVEAARLDGTVDGAERGRIVSLLADRFGLSPSDAAELVEEATHEAEAAVQLVGFTRTLKDAFDHDDRVRMIEMLWDVAYADGHLHDYEASLVRRVSGLLFVSDQDAGSARKRVLDRLGIDGGA